MDYKVVGPCRVAGVEPGGTVSQEVLEEAGANIDALLGVHLEPAAGGSGPAEPGGEMKPPPAPKKPPMP